MQNRWIIIGLAVALAAVVLLVTLSTQPQLGPAGPRPPTAIDDPLDDDLLRQFNPDENADPLEPRGQVDQYRLNSVNKKGQRIELFGDSLTPLAGGVMEVDAPGARVHLSPQRIFELRARHGTLVAPDNQPRNGQFVGDVVLILYEAAGDSPPNTQPGSADVKLTVWLDDARFDLELGQVESDGSVRLATPAADFRGTGLNLVFNDRKQRLDQLVIAKGESLRFHPAGPNANTSPAAPTAAADSPLDKDRRPNVPGTDSSAPDPTPQRQPQFYRARFDSAVRIQTPQAKLDADRLEVIFSLDGRSRNDPWLNQLGSSHDVIQAPMHTTASAKAPRSIPAHPAAPRGRSVASTSTAVLGDFLSTPFRWALGAFAPWGHGPIFSPAPNPSTTSAPVPPNSSDGDPQPDPQTQPIPTTHSAEVDSTTDHDTDSSVDGLDSQDQVVITWDGPLVVAPEESPPIDLTGPRDYLIQLVGRPIRVTTAKQETLTAARAEYLANEQRLRLFGTDPYGLRINSPRLGVLTGEQLVLYQQRGIGQILGRGKLETPGRPNLVDAMAPPKPLDPQRLPQGLSIRWSDRVDLAFNRSSSDGSRSAIHTLKEATFYESVAVHHPQLDLTTDQLRINLNPAVESPAGASGSIRAAGHVAVTARTAHEPFDTLLQAEDLSIDLTRQDDGRVRPGRISAGGGVEIKRPGQLVRATQLNVELAPRTEPGHVPDEDTGLDPDPTPTTQPNARRRRTTTDHAEKMRIARVTAQEKIEVVLDEPQMRLFADRLVADPDLGQLELFGSPAEQARIDQADGSLMGNHLILEQFNRSAHVNGPGQFVFLSRPPQPDAPGTPTPGTPTPGTKPDPTTPQPPATEPTGETPPLPAPAPSSAATAPATQPATELTEPLYVTRPRGWVTVTWNRAMHFDDAQGLVHLVGDVAATARSGQQAVTLRAQDLQFNFTRVPDTSDANWPLQSDHRFPQAPSPSRTLDGRAITAMTAREQVRLEAARFRPDTADEVESRLTLTGPLMTFDNLLEQIQILGPGTTLIENYRPAQQPDTPDPDTAATDDPPPQGWPSQLSGHGVTLVTWTGQLLLDAAHNDIQFLDRVQLVHRAAHDSVMQLDCRSMLIDLEATGGLPGWFSGRIPKPAVKEIHADDDVRLLSGRKAAYTDHLIYTGYDQTVLLRADEGKLTQFEDTDTGRSIRSESLKWDLTRQRVEIAHPSATGISVGRP